jgi:hypothetical protein
MTMLFGHHALAAVQANARLSMVDGPSEPVRDYFRERGAELGVKVDRLGAAKADRRPANRRQARRGPGPAGIGRTGPQPVNASRAGAHSIAAALTAALDRAVPSAAQRDAEQRVYGALARQVRTDQELLRLGIVRR